MSQSESTPPIPRSLTLAASFLLGAVITGAVLFSRKGGPAPARTTAVLSDSANAVLRNLAAPVELRFYSILDPATTSAELRAFAGRVDALLKAFQDQSGGKLQVARVVASADNAAPAASADGMRPFNHDRGDACFLGIALKSNGRSETLPLLSQRWEAALEYDIARAIERVAATQPAAAPPIQSTEAEKQTADKIRAAIPDLQSLPLDDAKRLLQERALANFKAASAQIAEDVKRAQEQLDRAQRSGSEGDQQAAMRQVQKLQAAQAERLQEISMELQEQLRALERLKSTPAP